MSNINESRIKELTADHLECVNPWFNKVHELLLHHSYWEVNVKDIEKALLVVDKTSYLLYRTREMAEKNGDEEKVALCDRIERDALRMALGMINRVREHTEDHIENRDAELNRLLYGEKE